MDTALFSVVRKPASGVLLSAQGPNFPPPQWANCVISPRVLLVLGVSPKRVFFSPQLKAKLSNALGF